MKINMYGNFSWFPSKKTNNEIVFNQLSARQMRNDWTDAIKYIGAFTAIDRFHSSSSSYVLAKQHISIVMWKSCTASQVKQHANICMYSKYVESLTEASSAKLCNSIRMLSVVYLIKCGRCIWEVTLMIYSFPITITIYNIMSWCLSFRPRHHPFTDENYFSNPAFNQIK